MLCNPLFKCPLVIFYVYTLDYGANGALLQASFVECGSINVLLSFLKKISVEKDGQYIWFVWMVFEPT